MIEFISNNNNLLTVFMNSKMGFLVIFLIINTLRLIKLFRYVYFLNDVYQII